MTESKNEVRLRAKAAYEPARSNEELLLRWLRRLRESQFSHYEEASRLRRYNFFLGVPVVIVGAVVGTSVFASLSADNGFDREIRLFIGVVSIMSAVLASLQTFMGFAERAEKHRATAARYGIARREIEVLIAEGFEIERTEKIKSLRANIDNLAIDAPNVSDRAARNAQRRMQGWRDDGGT